MSAHTANQTWVVQTGDRVIQKKAKAGVASLSDWERLVYCLWFARCWGAAPAADRHHVMRRRYPR